MLFDTVSTLILDLPWEETKDRPARTLSGGEQKRFALELLLRGTDEVLLLDEPDNFLDVPAKRWLEQRLRESKKSVLYVSTTGSCSNQTADRVVAVEGGSAWTHPGGFASWHEARVARHDSMEERRRRWDEEHEKLRAADADVQAEGRLQRRAWPRGTRPRRPGCASSRRRGRRRCRPRTSTSRCGCAARAPASGRSSASSWSWTNLTFPFDLELWYGDRLAVLGANGTGKSHFLRLLARGGTDPDPARAGRRRGARAGRARRRRPARRAGRPGHFSQTHDRPELIGQTLVDILWRGDEHRPSLDRQAAYKVLDRYELATQGEQRFGTLSGGQQARFLVLLLELSGVTLLLLDEPTDNLDLASAEALEQGLEGSRARSSR